MINIFCNYKRPLTILVVGLMFVSASLRNCNAEAPSKPTAEGAKGAKTKPGSQVKILERYIAVDNVCAWPNLTLMPDGTIIATIFNQPFHLSKPGGDVECWASTDGGKLWEKRGTPAIHEPETSRGNVAAGVAHNGDLIVLSAGLSYQPWTRLLPWVCRSSDGGKTWNVNKKSETTVHFPKGLDYRKHNKKVLKPFGDIVALPQGRLAASFYHDAGSAWVLFSDDDGKTWGDAKLITDDFRGETTVLRLRNDRWLAAARTEASLNTRLAPEIGLKLFTSNDEGQTWAPNQLLTRPTFELPGQLMQMKDGRVLLTYGMRIDRAIGFRISEDEGRTWGAPQILLSLDLSSAPPSKKHVQDIGYPSTVQLADGTLVTAYYAKGISQHNRYHMGVVRWRVPPSQ